MHPRAMRLNRVSRQEITASVSERMGEVMGLRRFNEAVGGIGVVIGLLAALFCASTTGAQSGTGTVRGQVTDPSGASVQNATIQVTGASGQPATTQSGRDGTYEVKGLVPGP